MDKFGTVEDIEKQLWITGKKFSELEHGHLSNIIYFMEYVLPEHYTPLIKVAMRAEIGKRFNGKILPYKPLLAVEIKMLRRKGLIESEPFSIVKISHDTIEAYYNIVVMGKKIGVVTIPHKANI